METFVECGRTPNSAPLSEVSRKRKSQSPPARAIKTKRCLMPSTPASSSSSDVQRPLCDNEISAILNYGSEEDSDDDEDADEIGALNVRGITRVNQMLLGLDEEDVDFNVDTNVSFSWPPPPIPSASPTVSPPPILRSVTPSPLPSAPVLSISSSSSSNLNVDKFDFNWREYPQPQIQPELRREPFSDINCGPTVPISSPYDAFTAIWDRDIMEHIARETNAYAQEVAVIMLEDGTLRPSSRITKWNDTDADELYVYFAIILATGVVVKSRLEEYWNKSLDIFVTPGFSASMSINRSLLLSKCLHFNDNAGCNPETMTRAQAKLFKVQPILDHLNNKFSELYMLSQNVALDESLTMWKGWLDINQFIRNKAAAVAIKTYEVCESQTGYLWRFEVHAGHDSVPQEDCPVSGIVPALVLRLLSGLEHQGHTIWMDNFYNSPALARELKTRGFDCVGTLRKDRQFVPVELTKIKKTDMEVGQVVGCTSGDVDLLVWRHKNRVAFVSTYHGLATTMCGETRKPTVVPDYNVCMGGVDRKDQMLAMYPIERRRTRIWYKKFFRRLLNASILNSYILYKHSHPQTHTHRSFRQTLVRDLLATHGKHCLPITIPSSGNAGHFPAQYGTINENSREHIRRSCAVCKKRTNVYCMACNKPLCVFTCFAPHHQNQQ